MQCLGPSGARARERRAEFVFITAKGAVGFGKVMASHETKTDAKQNNTGSEAKSRSFIHFFEGSWL